jgi:hypothetical protein
MKLKVELALPDGERLSAVSLLSDRLKEVLHLMADLDGRDLSVVIGERTESSKLAEGRKTIAM